ncbi:MAG: hypothetical protein DRQ47_08580 [Gammaproteobacteria bacterium]|nr:MAG: hypothetical protein DRQ47_08580 [Gammaproteobacteria bacterium]
MLFSPPSFAAEDTEEDEAYQKRVALSKKIKAMRELRKEMPVPPPAGLFGVYHLPEKGQFVTGINVQSFSFSGLLHGSDSVSAETVATTAPNIFFGNPMQPPTLRVIPKSVEANVLFPFINYAISDQMSLVAILPLIKKKLVMETFQGPMGTNSLGENTVRSNGVGDLKFGALYTPYTAYDDKGERTHSLLLSAVVSAPTGSIEEEDIMLTPMNTMTPARLAYGMQLGTGTWDALVGAAYWGKTGNWGWGAQYMATIPLEDENDNGWRFGDKHEMTGWASYSWDPTLVNSLRLRYETQDENEGLDPMIYGPGLGANPANYGGTKTEIIIGMNWMYDTARNLALEFSIPVAQDRNGYQLEQDYSIMLSWRNAFF